MPMWEASHGKSRETEADLPQEQTTVGAPYTLFGEDQDDSPLGRGFPAGLYEIQVEAYSESDLGGDHLQRIWFIKFRVNDPATGAPTIGGTAQVGQTLTASTTGISDHDGLTNVTYTLPVAGRRDRNRRGDEFDLHGPVIRQRQGHQGSGELHRRRRQ